MHESKGQSKALRYLKLWYSNKKCKEDQSLEPWKFEKCRQIWLLQNCYSSVRVPPEDFKILLKYMSTINGRMRDGAIGEFCYKLYFLRSIAQFFTRKKFTTISYVIINLYHQRGTGSRWAGFIFQGIFWPWPRLNMKFMKARSQFPSKIRDFAH